MNQVDRDFDAVVDRIRAAVPSVAVRRALSVLIALAIVAVYCALAG